MTTSFILGAGVDRALGLPLANQLLSELSTFEIGEGKAISKAIKAKLGGGRRVRFTFEKYRANQGEGFAERVLTDSSLSNVLQGALAKLGNGASSGAAAVQALLTRLQTIREANDLEEATAITLATLGGDSEGMADYTMLRTRGMALNPAPRNAIVRIFRDARDAEDLSDEEVEALDTIVEAMTNFEELLARRFAGFYSADPTETRTYLYIAWLLWTYIRWKSIQAQPQITARPNFYSHLQALAPEDSIVTFNYTTFGDLPGDRTVRFHGECTSYIRVDRGELLPDDGDVLNAGTLDALCQFIERLELDIEKGQVFIPGIVPPSAMKPLINRAFIARWAQADAFMAEADTLIVVGYAFNRIDSHFNDLFRATASGKRIAVINPDLENTRSAVCSLLGIVPNSLTRVNLADTVVERSDRLLFVPLRCEDVTTELLARIRSGW